MARYRKMMAMRPVQRIKHVIDSSATITAAVQLKTNLVKAVDAPTIAGRNEVITGSKVYGVYLKVVVASNQVTEAGAIPNVYLIVWKNPSNVITAPAPASVGNDDTKKFVIHQEMSMIQNQVSGNPTVLFNGVIKIPKGYQRFGPNDRLDIEFVCPQIDVSFCVQAHYKEFR